MRTSMVTTSGRSVTTCATAVSPSAASPTTDPGALEERAQGAERPRVVDEQAADHARGRS
jgi:hypothetical protein